jgi:tRNA threonylcarbamoyladenosine biosynthesis protein TsaE
MRSIWQIESPDEITIVAEGILISAKQKIILFSGSLGAGKTTLIKAICHQLGVKENTASPTFAIVHEYAGKENIFHFDLFRINTLQELIDLGFAEYLESETYIFIEWPQIAEPLLEGYDCAKVNIVIETDLKRSITLEA